MDTLTIGELIEALEAIVADCGADVPVLAADDSSIHEAIALDADGDTRGPAVVVVLRERT